MAGPLTQVDFANLKRVYNGPLPEVFIETGTFKGETARVASGVFKKVLTVEASNRLFSLKMNLPSNVERFHELSVDFLNWVVRFHPYPVCFFLDAHYNGVSDYDRTPYRGPEDVPMLEELKIIARRPYRDLIICDDYRLFGKQEGDLDWRAITTKSCLEAVGDVEVYAALNDRLIIVKER